MLMESELAYKPQMFKLILEYTIHVKTYLRRFFKTLGFEVVFFVSNVVYDGTVVTLNVVGVAVDVVAVVTTGGTEYNGNVETVDLNF